jgi:altronate dehydratase small subunit
MLDEKDNVATAIADLKAGSLITVNSQNGAVEVSLTQNIPLGHKFALKDIPKGGAIVKYGEIIGRARNRLHRGEHAHVHNVEGLRGRGDRP